VGCGLVLAGSAPGVALEWYVVAYAVARFGLELLRGDAGRVYLLGFSEAQWTSVALPLLVVAGEVAGALPWRAWTVAAAALPVAAMGALAARRHLARVAGHRLLCPRHVRATAEALAAAAAAADQPAVRTTSLGIRVSRGEVPTEQVVTSHYTLSRAGRDLDAATAKVLAGLIVRLRRQDGGHDVVAGRRGVFHVIVQEAAAQDRNRAVVPPVGGALSRAGPCR